MANGLGAGPRTVDILLCLGVTGVLAAVVSADQGGEVPLSPVAYLWAVGLGSLMLIRRSRPRLVLALTVCGFFSYYAAGFPAIGISVPIAAALYSAAEAGYLRTAVATAVGVLVVSNGFRVITGQSVAYVVGYELVEHVALTASVIALGYSVRARRALQLKTAQVARLVAHQTYSEAETRAGEQRIRLARELHDSIGHALSVASLYSDVAREADDGATRLRALAQVRSAVSEAMAQLRSTVALLRSSDTSELPLPGVSDIPRLLDAPTTAGYHVGLEIDDAVTLPNGAGTAAYRVVQESVANTLRHSNATAIQVQLCEDGHRVRLQVRDNGTGTRSPRFSAGHGLSGMRERVEELGGDLDVRADAAGWLVTASLPRGA